MCLHIKSAYLTYKYLVYFNCFDKIKLTSRRMDGKCRLKLYYIQDSISSANWSDTFNPTLSSAEVAKNCVKEQLQWCPCYTDTHYIGLELRRPGLLRNTTKNLLLVSS